MRPKGWQVSSPRYASFLVRVWRADRQEAAPSAEAWQGELEHIQSGQQWTFQALEELVHLLRRQVEEAGATGGG
jgi:hypothetical protein